MSEAEQTTQHGRRDDFRAGFVLLSGVVFLALLFYFGRIPFFDAHLAQYFPNDPNVGLYGHLYLATASLITRTLLPLLCIWFILKERPRDYGYRLRGSGSMLKVYGALMLIMLPVLFVASGTEAFLSRYPLYAGAGNSWQHLIVYECSYLLVFLSGESFWRGYLVFGMHKAYGYLAIGVMVIPYVMIHFGKPLPETFGALITGCVLGYLALKHRSFWLGVALHFSVALSMDLLALWRKGAFGTGNF